MNAAGFDVGALLKMRHSPIRNYAIPGVTSWLIGSPSPAGTLRLFESEREHQESVAPHSHRFDFQCWVLRGTVRNRIWRESYFHDPNADKFRSSSLHYLGASGKYEQRPIAVARYSYTDTTYAEGECYGMAMDEIHSIWFSRGARILFFEGAVARDWSTLLEPVAYGEPVPTFKVDPWMFARDRPSGAERRAEGTPSAGRDGDHSEGSSDGRGESETSVSVKP